MTEYLTKYMETVAERMKKCSDKKELDEIFDEHMDKIAFMQHERLIHFLVTFMFALVLCLFIAVLLFLSSSGGAGLMGVTALIVIIMPLECFYVKHYYFLENTVQKMYRVYDELLAMKKTMEGSDK